MNPCHGQRERVLRQRSLTALLAAALLLAQPPGEAQPAPQPVAPAPDSAADSNGETPWPYGITRGNTQITVYQPQLDNWDGFKLTARAAVAVSESKDSAPKFGVIEVTSRTLVDKASGLVTLDRYEVVKADFPTAGEQASRWADFIREDAAGNTRTIALDRLEAGLAIVAAENNTALTLKNDPPVIVFSTVPALLVYVDGTPVFKPVQGNAWQRLVNTRPLVLKAPEGTLYLHVFDGWLTGASLQGQWSVAASPPAELAKLEKQAVDSRQIDLMTGSAKVGQPAPSLKNKPVPVVRIATRPTELIVSDGALKWVPIAGTQLLYAENTTGNLFRLLSDQKLYLLISGRWFRSAQAIGPWAFVPANQLAKDFTSIPDDSPKENVKASVAGTPQAREAAISASVPETAAVKRNDAKLTNPIIDGEPTMVAISGTPLSYVQNTATPIVQVDARSWFAVENGVWFSATSVRGPWVVATNVPAVIYTIPASSPLHYVTYVRTYGADGDTVYVGYTPGYHGECLDPVTHVVVYGTGYYYDPWVGSVWYGPPVTYGFGAATTYTPWNGWAFAFGLGWFWGAATVADGWGWGPYPWWGPYGWGWAWGPPIYWGGAALGPRGGAAVWGPGGWAAATGNVYSHWGNTARVSRASAGYNSWTGNAWAGHAGISYNSRTGTLAAGQHGAVQNVYTGNYAEGGRGVARNTETGVVAAGRAGTIGNAYTGKEISGGSGVIYNPKTGNATHISGISGDNGRIVDVNGDVYAGHDGNVYRKTDDGWQHHDDGGWQPVDKGANQNRDLNRDLDDQRSARDLGSQRFQGRQNAMGNMRGSGGRRR